MNVRKKTTGAKLPSISNVGRRTASKPDNLVKRKTMPPEYGRTNQTANRDKMSGSRNLTITGDQLTSPTPHETKFQKPVPTSHAQDVRPKLQLNGKMSLVCQLKMSTLRREANLIKQTLPLTDDVVEVLKEKSAIDARHVHRLKKTDITSRWDPVLDFLQENNQMSIFGIWDFLIQRKDTLLPSRLQETFNSLVNQHFENDLQPLQLNKDRQNKVARVMLDNLRKADGYVDELSASIREYQMYTHKISDLVKSPGSEYGSSDGSSHSHPSPNGGGSILSHIAEVPESMHVVYDRIKTYVNNLEETDADQKEEIERVQIKLYEAHSEIETLENKANKLRMDIKAKQQQIKNLQDDREALGKELNQTKQELDDVKNQRFQVDKKLDEMMNAMMKGMDTLKQDVTSQLKKEIGEVAQNLDQKVGSLEDNMNARMDEFKEGINEIKESQDDFHDDLERFDDKMEDMQKHKKDKNMNLKISIRGGEVRDDQLIRTRSDKLRSVQGK